ncbi:MAG TPA: cache domain-containing protein, partial [Candidatus Eremiobacteraeota bacterium]|nr:cache domain-containing protein [Candidatus Eremiobacteraeota bacterium]
MKNTLKFKLIFWIWGITVILVSLISYTNFKHEANQVKKHLEENALNLASYQAKKIDEQFSKAAVIPVMNAISMENFFNIEDETIVAEYLKEVIEKNDYIYGSCFAFEPNSFEEGKKYFAPYYHFSKVKEGIPEYIVLGDDTYNYFNQDWYRLPRNSENPVWIEPYLDTGVRVFMVTYATRFQLGDKIAGVTTSDISLVQLTDEINNIKLYDTGYAFIVSNKGVLLAYPEYWYELCYSTMKKLKDNNFTEENLKALEPLRNKRYIETELTGELKKLSFNDKEILTILNCAVKIINNLSEINKKYPATTTLTIKMLDQMTIAKEKAISEDIAKNTAVLEERASERFLWYKINEKTINRLKHTIPDDKLTFLKSLLNKSYEKIELNNKLKQAGFNDPNKILDYAEKTEMPWYLINKRIIKNKLTNNIPPEKLKFLEEIINNRVLSTEDLRRELKKLGFKDKTDKTDEITEILEQLKESNSLPLTSNDKNLSILSKKLTEKYEVNVKSINKIRAKKNLVFMLADLGFNDQEITEITDELQT